MTPAHANAQNVQSAPSSPSRQDRLICTGGICFNAATTQIVRVLPRKALPIEQRSGKN